MSDELPDEIFVGTKNSLTITAWDYPVKTAISFTKTSTISKTHDKRELVDVVILNFKELGKYNLSPPNSQRADATACYRRIFKAISAIEAARNTE